MTEMATEKRRKLCILEARNPKIFSENITIEQVSLPDRKH